MINLHSEDIDATLKDGQIFASKRIGAILVCLYILLSVVLAIVIAMLIGIPLTVGEFDTDSIVAIVCCDSMYILFLIISALLSRHIKASKKKIDLYLQDAVLLKAKTKSIGEKLLFRGIMVRKAIAIEVEFDYNGIKYTRQSAYNEKLTYLPIYINYANKTVTIAYSPQYDEVMFIKHNVTESNRVN